MFKWPAAHRVIVRRLVIALIALVTGPRRAEAGPLTEPAIPSVAAVQATLGTRPPAASKISSHLVWARDAWRAGRSLADLAAANPFIHSRDQKVKVDLRLDTPADETALKALATRGMTVESHVGGLVSGWISLDDLDAVAALPSVTTIHPDHGCRRRNAGSAPNQADVSLRAAIARSTYGVNGGGVRIGVLSDSINDTRGGSISGGCLTNSLPQQSGDLPAQVGVLDAGPGGGIDEGAGMAELIYDLCPSADIAFRTAFRSLPDFANGIIELAGSGGCGRPGCHVICDDVIYYAEPMFQDGEAAQAVDAVVAAGIPFFSSAGNDADKGLDQNYTQITASGRSVHDFTGSGDGFLNVTFGAGGGQILAVLQWNQPFSGTLGPGSEIDFDLFLTRSTSNWASGANIEAGSANVQGDTGAPAGDPVEIFSYSRPSSATRFIVIQRFAGATTARLRLVIFTQGNVTFQAGILGGATIYGHPAAAGAIAVAAVYYREVDTNGGYSGGPEIDVESFSSRGGDLPFYFGPTGSALPGAPQLRFKPEIASVDGTNTTFFYGSDSDVPADGFPNFFGTSAAAPHAAAIAALMLDRAVDLGISQTPAQLYTKMRTTAVDIEAAGRDPFGGDGLVLADAAVGSLTAACSAPQITQHPTTQAVCSGASVTLSVTATGTAPLGYQWRKDTTNIAGATAATLTFNPVGVGNAGSYDVIVTNACGSVTSDAATLTVDVAPSIGAISAADGETDANCETTVTFSASVTDDVQVDAADVTVSVTLQSGSAALGTPIITKTQVNTQTVHVTGSVGLSDLATCNATVLITVDAQDACGSPAAPASAQAAVTNATPPMLAAPADIAVPADAGACSATFPTLPQPIVTDTCPIAPTPTFARSDGKPNLLDPYDAADSPISITWTAGDGCGNTAAAVQTIAVTDANEVLVDIELSPTLDDPSPSPGNLLTRCVAFELWNCAGSQTSADAAVSVPIAFSVDAGLPHRATGVSLLVPCGTYTCMTAGDPLHTVRSMSPDFTDDGATYAASFLGNRRTGGHWLVGGNVNDDTYVDVLDFVAYVLRFGRTFATGDTDCSTPFFHPDFTGDGLVFTNDFTYIQINFLTFDETCCGLPPALGPREGGDPSRRVSNDGSGAQPVARLRVADLWRLGLNPTSLDLNRDGWIDDQDMALFGQEMKKRDPSSGA